MQTALELLPAIVLLVAIAAVVLLGVAVGMHHVLKLRRERGTVPLTPPGPAMDALPASGKPPPDTPLQLRLGHRAGWHPTSWAIGLGVGAWLLATDPETLWTAWLSWPAALMMALATPLFVRAAFCAWRARLVVSGQGVVLHRCGRETSIAWKQVGGLLLLTTWRKGKESLATGSRTVSYVERRTLRITDRQGRLLLEVDAPLRPPDRYAALLDALPAWSGVPVRLHD
ncbi:MAG: hypothetical protein KA603_13230 [Azonexus sp.]|nr:hypothetical protein [Betaproteobacteria bacterium]MBP6037085.1 hypothetical protein [Azonexus sp.]MBP6907550.1 hypothetical protein [Azonexus sp.]